MESYIVHLDISATFNRVSHSGLLFKLKLIGVGGSVLSICREFLSNCRQGVIVDGTASERSQDPNHFWHATGKCVRSSSVHPLYQ